jgi:hypothetical protein
MRLWWQNHVAPQAILKLRTYVISFSAGFPVTVRHTQRVWNQNYIFVRVSDAAVFSFATQGEVTMAAPWYKLQTLKKGQNYWVIFPSIWLNHLMFLSPEIRGFFQIFCPFFCCPLDSAAKGFCGTPSSLPTTPISRFEYSWNCHCACKEPFESVFVYPHSFITWVLKTGKLTDLQLDWFSFRQGPADILRKPVCIQTCLKKHSCPILKANPRDRKFHVLCFASFFFLCRLKLFHYVRDI